MKHAEAQGAVLARMAESRAELIAAHIADEPLRVTRAPRIPRALPATTTRPVPWFLRTPNAELIALALVGIAILGVRRTVQTAVGAGLSASTHRAFSDVLNALRE
ncbi:hypothetical protein NOV72_00995 [Caballeronia novacaledonica]|uniref:Uncharacterized protein n=1 Tax=Caballeronia novacaledonica TaxID=1544861 RepID=A0A2U3I0V7_9BURK|nr:hypothetical protein [Caballeronia novacaledonica]SPB13731.1 hypothetical protein NOV72_00995 [Caballeronia novacaledonica]